MPIPLPSPAAPAVRSRIAATLEALRAVAGNRDIGRLEAGWAASVAADWTYVVAVMVAAYQTDGVAAVGVVGVGRMLVATVTAPLVSSLVGHLDPQRLLIRVELVRLLAVGAAGIALAAHIPAIVLLLAVAVEAGAFATIRPIQMAMLPGLARTPTELVAGNVASSTGEGFGTLVGPALGGIAVAWGGPVAASAAVVLLLVVATLVIMPIRMTVLPHPELARERGSGLGSAWRASRTRLGQGLAVVRDRPAPRGILTAFGAQVVVRGILNVLLVVAAIRLLGLGESGVGLLNSAIGLGGLVGAVGATALVGRPRLAIPLVAGLVCWGLPIAVAGALPTAVVGVVSMVVLGSSNAVLDIAGYTLLQRIVPNQARGAVMGLLEGLVGVGVALGSVIGPVLIAWLGIQGAMVITGAILPITALLLWPLLARADAEAVIPGRELALLRSLPFFAPLPLTALEQVAGRMRPVTFAAGDLLTVQGEPGDCFYLIDDGAVEIERDGRLVPAVGPVAAVGEIALLRRVPRTATVRATRETRAFSLTGPDFVAAVAASPQGIASADAIMAQREIG